MTGHLDLLDWRRTIAATYAGIRAAHAEDPLRAHDEWRGVRDRLFAEHPQSPLEPSQQAAFSGIAYHPYDPDLSFSAPVDTDVAPDRFEVPTSTGGSMTVERCGTVDLPIGRLQVYWLDIYGGGIFLPFRDATSGDTTYGGGRYLLDTIKGADLGSTSDGRLVLDFNFAYHPSCRYSPSWNCPLAPPDNWLAAPVAAGELL